MIFQTAHRALRGGKVPLMKLAKSSKDFRQVKTAVIANIVIWPVAAWIEAVQGRWIFAGGLAALATFLGVWLLAYVRLHGDFNDQLSIRRAASLFPIAIYAYAAIFLAIGVLFALHREWACSLVLVWSAILWWEARLVRMRFIEKLERARAGDPVQGKTVE
jgi:hypothetical protein